MLAKSTATDLVTVINERLALVEGRYGRYLVPRTDIFVGHAIEFYGEYCHGEAEALIQLVKPGFSIVEVGAHIGAHTVVLAQAAGNGHVIAIEPQSALVSFIHAQKVLNSLDNLSIVNMAVGDEDHVVYLPDTDYAKRGNFGGIAIEDLPTNTPVPMVQLDHLVKHTVNLLKIDCEGSEEKVLRGASKIIMRDRPIIYCENDRVENSSSLISYLQSSLNYRLFWHMPFLFSKNNYFGQDENIYHRIASFNMLCVPQEVKKVDINLREILSSDEPHPLMGRVNAS